MSVQRSTHDCVEQINKLLADQNTAISTPFSFSEPKRELVQIVTHKVDRSKRGKPVAFFASFCPFCGIKLKKS